MANQVPEKLINFRVYRDGVDMLGVADVTLPDLEAMTETVKGAGIAGEVDSPVLGHFQSMTMALNWRVPTKDVVLLAQQKAHSLDCRGSIQIYDAGAGAYKTVGLKVVTKVMPKKTGIGKLDVGTTTDTSNEFEVLYIKVLLDGAEILEIDKYNYICKINGVNYLADVRRNLGLN